MLLIEAKRKVRVAKDKFSAKDMVKRNKKERLVTIQLKKEKRASPFQNLATIVYWRKD